MEQIILKGGTSLINVPEFLDKVEIGTGQVIADLGCGGGGHFVAPLALRVGSAGLVYAVDIQKKVLSSLEASLKIQNIGNVKIVWSDLERVGAASIPDSSCDVAIVANVLFQNKNHFNIIQEAARIVKGAGRVVVIDWKLIAGMFGPPQELRIKPDEIRAIANDLKLKFVEMFDVGSYHFAIVLGKES